MFAANFRSQVNRGCRAVNGIVKDGAKKYSKKSSGSTPVSSTVAFRGSTLGSLGAPSGTFTSLASSRFSSSMKASRGSFGASQFTSNIRANGLPSSFATASVASTAARASAVGGASATGSVSAFSSSSSSLTSSSSGTSSSSSSAVGDSAASSGGANVDTTDGKSEDTEDAEASSIWRTVTKNHGNYGIFNICNKPWNREGSWGIRKYATSSSSPASSPSAANTASIEFIQLKRAIDGRKYPLAWALFTQMELRDSPALRQLSVEDFNLILALIQSYRVLTNPTRANRRMKIDMVRKVMQSSTARPNEDTYSILLDVYARDGDLVAFQDTLKEMGDLKVELPMLELAMKQMAAIARYRSLREKEGFPRLPEDQEQSLDSDLWRLFEAAKNETKTSQPENALLAAFSDVHDEAKLVGLFEAMRAGERSAVVVDSGAGVSTEIELAKPNLLSYMHVIRHFGFKGDVEKVSELFEAFKANAGTKGKTVNPRVHKVVLWSYVRAERVDLAKALIEEMANIPKFPYDSTMRMYEMQVAAMEGDRLGTWQAFKQYKRLNGRVRLECLDTLAKAHVVASSQAGVANFGLDDLDEILDQAGMLKPASNAKNQKPASEEDPSITTRRLLEQSYNNLARGFAAKANMDGWTAVTGIMESKGLNVYTQTYNSLLLAQVKNDMLDDALRTLGQLKRKQLEQKQQEVTGDVQGSAIVGPNGLTYSSLVTALAKASRPADILLVLEAMEEDGMPVSARTRETVRESLGEVEGGEEVLKKLEAM
ncbi:hypothetical protein HK102_001397 [Quaeritorhiza haematococci]|nr:hypothetical protein HK102_001397 [Quaeritorhiza haematococci]